MAALFAVAVIYIAFLIALYFYQDKLVFPRARPNWLLYEKLDRYSEEVISDGCSLQGWRIDGSTPDSRLVCLYFGGNGDDPAQLFDSLSRVGVSCVYAFNYRGYGLSEGVPSEKHLFLDALNIFDDLLRKNPEKNFVLMGHSLGSAVAGYLASMRPVSGLVLLSPLFSITRIAKGAFFNLVPGFLIRHRFDLASYAKKIDVASFVLVAKNDLVIPSRDSLSMYEVLPGEKSLLELECGHNDFFCLEKTFSEINGFLAAVDNPS
ncbi:alpha/beta hydrolase [Pseudomonadota bacterium]